MKKILRNKQLLILATFLLIIITSFAIGTIARYVATLDVPFNNNGTMSDSVDFTVNTVFQVKNQNELFAAINQGYSYIQISNDLKNPFVITQSPKNLTTDLILDLNGIELYRHGTDPVFTISEGVRLTITDTSETQRGCLYNPTGSVIKISGGTLTVVSGKFECGPRYSEYYSYNNHILSKLSHKRTLVDKEAQLVEFFTKTTDPVTGKITFTESQIKAPIISVYNTSYDGNVHHHGNVYFDIGVGPDAPTDESTQATGTDLTIYPDTYCYYTTSEDDSYELMKSQAQKADWYYTYYVHKDTLEYCGPVMEDGADPDDHDEVTIYGYEKTIYLAETHDGVRPEDIDEPSNNFYAAIKMSGGVMDILYGDFYNYFGVNTTACIDMMGGKLTIKEGNFSTRIPNASSHRHEMVDAKEDDAAAFERHNYFNDFYWAKYKKTLNPDTKILLADLEGARAYKGEGFCIMTSGDAKIDIGNGNFYSSNNNLIHMQNGTLNIGGGNFKKTNTIRLKEYNHTDTGIFMHNGNLTIDKAEYYIEGDFARAIRMMDGVLNISDARCEMHGDYSFAVHSTIPGNDKLNLTNVEFYMYSTPDNNVGKITGIYSAKTQNGEVGSVNIRSTDGKTSKIYIEGNGSAGIYTDGGLVISENCDYEILGTSSSGIYANGGEVILNGGNVKLNSDIGCYGVYAISKESAKSVNVTVTSANINVGYVDTTNTPPPNVDFDDNDGAGLAASVGVYLASANDESYVRLNNSNIYSYEVGVALSGGHLIMSDTDTTENYIKTDRASAIAVFDGNLTFSEGGTYSITSFNTTSGDCVNSYNLTLPQLSYTDGSYNISPVLYPNTDGIYVSGGTLTSDGYLNLTHTGLENETYIDDSSHTYRYTSLNITSYAIRVVGGSVTMLNGNITAKAGGGICCSKTDDLNSTGHITMGREGYNGSITIHTDGEDYITGTEGRYEAIGTYISTGWQSQRSITGGHAIELNGGNIEVFYGTYEADFGNGIAAKGSGTITVHAGEFYGWMGQDGTKITGKSGPSAFYGLKVIGGATVEIYGGTFNGGNGGAFVTGIDNFESRSSISGNLANVYVYAGIFGGNATVDSFNVYDLSNVVFGAHPEGYYANAAAYKSAIMMNATSATIAANKITQSNVYEPVNIRIYYGDYDDGDKGGVWNDGNFASIVAYNTVNAIDYTDIGGSVTLNNNATPVYYKRDGT